MSDTLSLSLYHTDDIILIYTALKQLEKRSGYHFNKMKRALQELLENTLEHAYDDKKEDEIAIKVTFSLQECQLQVTLQEFGKPFDFSPYLSESIDGSSDHSKGFYLIYDLVETFYFANLGKEGKRFTLISQLKNCSLTSPEQPSENKNTLHILDDITVRTFQEEDAEAISQLIYKNYDYTYYKPFFYTPKSVKSANLQDTIHSILALHHQKIIGHFALVPRINTHCCEVAVAVVHPNYKSMGVMGRMFDTLINEATKRNYRSIFGEAIMLHPYSQKANLKKGMKESALVLGLVPNDIEIEHNLRLPKRSGVLVGYRLFEDQHYALNIPSQYKQWIDKTYQQFELNFENTTDLPQLKTYDVHTDKELNLIAIEINTFMGDEAFTTLLETILLEQSDMIYVDINLHRIKEMDTLIDLLNHHGFFYAGVMFDFYHDEDYLRLQKVCTHNIELEHLVTYSEFGKDLLAFVREDKKRIF